MKNYHLLIGSHVAFKAPNYLLGSVQEAISYGANTFMVYTGAPQNSKRVAIDLENVQQAHDLAKQNGIDFAKVIAHGPYIINLASIEKAKLSFARHFLISELKRANQLGISIFVVHPGGALENPRQDAISSAAETISIALKTVPNIKIAVETMAGKSSEIGCNFLEMRAILDKIDPSVRNRVGVCLDTCHIHDAGYNLVENFDSVINEFDHIVGLDNILVIHLNDSKSERSAKKDRHENIGKGKIGIESLMKIAYSERLENIPKILETPYIDNKPPYKEEIELIKLYKNN